MNTSYAGAGRRFVAALIDSLILGVVNFVISMATGTSSTTSTSMDAMAGMAFVLQLVVAVLYFVVYQNKSGQTLGKKVMGLRVVDASGNTPGMGTLALRELLGKTVSGLILGIGYLMILWDGRKQGLHDKIASTFVVRV